MNPPICEREQAVLHAARLGRLDGDLREHAGRCAVCADVAVAARFMNLEAESSASDHPLPDPARIWWRAQLLARREAAARAARPIAIAEQAAFACALVALVIAALWGWPVVSGWMGDLVSSWTKAPATASPQPGLSLGVLAGLLLLPIFLALTVLTAARTER